MKKYEKKCCNCKNYECYYLKGEWKYFKAPYGICRAKCKAVSMHDNCEKFVYAEKNYRHISDLTYYYLSDLMSEISEIVSLLGESDNV